MRIFQYIILSSLLLVGCVEADDYDFTSPGNVEALWKIMDEHYCFFDYKKEQLGVDWDEVRSRYVAETDKKLTTYQLFEVCSAMIGELKDGHVNLVSSFDVGRNWSWREDYPTNFSDTLQRRYLGTDYRISSGLSYRILDDNIGYVYCGTFESEFGSGNLDYILSYLLPCNGLIIDIRSNGGGMITAAQRLAARFIDEDLNVGYMQHKTGKGHNDFSSPEVQTLHPGDGLRWHKGVCVLTNRGVYSAANEFVKYMKAIGAYNVKEGNTKQPVYIVGDRTGGGAGMPFSSELPNGWAVRFSACPMYDSNMQITEHGIDPDYSVSLSDEDFAKGKDTIIEYARNLFK